MPNPDLSKLSDTEIIEHLKDAKSDKIAAELAVKKINNEIILRKDKELRAALKSKAEPYGTVNILVGDQKVKFDYKKKVVWDQAKLEATAKQISADGGIVSDYIKTKYEVAESKWKAWGDNIRAYFIDARTVSVQSITISLGDEGEEESE